MAIRQTIPNQSWPIVSNSLMTQDFYTFIQAVGNSIPIVGTGSPEGVITATQRAFYIDEAGSAGSVLYVKKLNDIGGNKSLGWVLV